ncbi:P-loop NTPase fold protein [Paenibacillus chitinolyticus]|uniref:P-loop NTPase fold protein n=1 Tax=Paenibacillus chitinolyticus TaxID=79263 RepID=UPI001C46FAE7|nr:P-loop NTPase fold protein [Paenibacillus chitinolyticus]MBV6715567.1 KAP family NTPase [Paenibacillus chitinolyticus]
MNYITDSIINYVKKDKTNYAVLLNGSWGSGKTYFWENTLRPEIEKIKIDGKKLNVVYISLYGVKTLEEVNKKIFLENLKNVIPQKNRYYLKLKKVLDFTKKKNIDKSLSELGKIIFSLDITGMSYVSKLYKSKVQFENFINFKNVVLCFDDLERTDIALTQILGYINNFVERDGTKVIIISNEKEISEKHSSENLELKTLVSLYLSNLETKNNSSQSIEKESSSSDSMIIKNKKKLFGEKNDYKRIKEKLIGKTFTYEPNDFEIINQLINEYSGDYKEYIKNHEEVIIEFFVTSQTKNFRVLKHALDDFELIHSKFIEYKYSDQKNILIDYFRFTLACSFEVKTGVMGNEEFAELNSSESFSTAFIMYEFTKSKKSKPDSYINTFVNKYYPNSNIHKDQIFFKFIEILVRNGVFYNELFKKETDSIVRKSKRVLPDYIRLLGDFRSLSNEEFDKITIEIFSKLKDGKVSFIHYRQAFLFYRHFIEKGLFNKDYEEVEVALSTGLILSGKRSQYKENLDDFLRPLITEEEDPCLYYFQNEIININENLEKEMHKDEVSNLMNLFQSNYEVFSEKLLSEFYSVPIFYYYVDINNFFESLLQIPNSDTHSLRKLLEKKYNQNEKNIKDIENLKLLKNKIDEHVCNNNINLKNYLLNELSKTLEECIKKLEKVKQQKDEAEA